MIRIILELKVKTFDNEGILEIILNKNPFSEPIPVGLGGTTGLATSIRGVRAHFPDGTFSELSDYLRKFYKMIVLILLLESSNYRFDISYDLKGVDFYSFFGSTNIMLVEAIQSVLF